MMYYPRVSRIAVVSLTATVWLAIAAMAQTREPSTIPIISTVAGCCEPNGSAGYGGDGGPATSAFLDAPYGVAVDPAGNFYIADYQNNAIRKVTISTGIITTVAGDGVYAYSGDGGPATKAQMELPQGLTVDSAANIYIADNNDCLIRKVTASTGIITTVAGNTTGAGTTSHSNCKYSGDGGPATNAQLNFPGGVAVDSAGNIYISDDSNHRIRKVTVATGIITTVAGNGTAGYTGDGGPATGAEISNGAGGVAVDAAGNIYIADDDYVVRKVAASTGIITTVAGINGESGSSGDGGPATSAELDGCRGLGVDSAGNFYFADFFDGRVRKVTVSTGIINLVAGGGSCGSTYCGDGGPATSAQLNYPYAAAVDSAGDIYIADDANNVIREVSLPKTATTTGLASSVNPSGVGEIVTFTATVSPSGSPNPTGTVTFTSNGTTITGCSAITLSPSRTAGCSASSLAEGSDAIVAYYSGDTNYSGSNGTLTQVVLPPTTTAVTSSLNPSTIGQSVTLTATVSPVGSPLPTGTVSFTSNGADISGCPADTLPTSLMVTCTSSSLPVGTDTIVATYSGDSNYAGSTGALAQLVNPIPTPVQFFPVSPCRVVDTRGATGPFGGPELAAGTSRSFTIPDGPCAGIPATVSAYSLNVTVVPPGPLGYLTIWPTGEGQPSVSTLNSLDGRIKANAALVPAGTSGAVTVYVNNTSNVVLDINGYFASSSESSLQFFPLTPCRVVDTRTAVGPLGGPSLVADTERDFPVQSSSCGIPSTAMAYSLNFTAVPPATGDAVGYLTVWPQGETRPVVSTLNDLTGTVVANAAIVPGGATDGEIAVYANNATNLVIDVNGYFAAAGTGFSLYALTPCRVLDTRKTTGTFTGDLTVKVNTSACAPPSAAQAYVFNATVVPSGDLGYLTLWPDEETQPLVSTLNALDGDITSNMAIVPNKDGETDAYASGTTQLILDISAYFAP